MSKVHIKKIIMPGGSLVKLLGPLIKTGLPFIKVCCETIRISRIICCKQFNRQFNSKKKMYGSGTTTVIISNNELNDIIKIVQALESQGISLKGVTEKIKNDIKKQKGGALGMLLGTLGALGNLLSGKGLYRSEHGLYRSGNGLYRSRHGNKEEIKRKPHPLTNFEIQNYYKNEPIFNGVYFTDNLPKTIKNGAHVINLDEYADTGTPWIALYAKNNEVIYFDFDSFDVEHVPKEIKKFIGQKNMKTNIFRIQAYNSIMCGYFYWIY